MSDKVKVTICFEIDMGPEADRVAAYGMRDTVECFKYDWFSNDLDFGEILNESNEIYLISVEKAEEVKDDTTMLVELAEKSLSDE